ncbi:MAG: cytochrome c oxidase subunit II [Prolixibacteraceae bacterium]|jgi:cytochrome c oxidase subunit II|nr:cytochrome c oxidase subunit II [Prolixibacteraceae bacterium]MBT6004837.1 cytochrome c oxidase subunit II [Prolixibacteraceae bacterium]MBT6763579.1 cytochrome c oxidase subunit II [Prolixibacteraceae bacterium]MBT7001022.1 cytochrome c oxidase subunit II [Prolixibacteraceae bacterium]MBT7393690.1 cytochrome c oxidase subunit II [Prolixibacteraceae bacterium]
MYSPEVTQASNFVQGVDTAFLVILGISFFFLIVLTVVMIYFIYKYNRKRNPVATQIHGNTTLEIIWTVVPFLLTMVMFYYGWAGWKPMQKAPKDSMEITVYGRMWNFSFEYENGKRTDTLFLPKDQPIKLNLVAMDVLHSLYIPAFRVKQDMVPGMENNFMWFEPQREGIFELYCAEYCGLQHSYMYTYVKVMEENEFTDWLVDTTQVAALDIESPTATGKRIMQNIGCFACHSLDGSKLVGPSFKGIWGEEHTVVTGKETRQVLVDEEYIKSSIYDPNEDVVEGFSKGLMLSYRGQLSDDDITNIVEYLKTLK